jgi:Ser-tRNA(Ala) deacylase AlaX
MIALNRKTQKLYYEQPLLAACNAAVVKVTDNHIELDGTIAYPEGGGQESDHGTLILPDGKSIPFIHARKLYGTRPPVNDVPDILVDGIIQHEIGPGFEAELRSLRENDVVQMHIDTARRGALSLSHTASHLLYLAVSDIRPDAVEWTLGCHIRIGSARFDFGVTRRFTSEEVERIEALTNAYVERGSAVLTYAHPAHADVRYWECEQRVIACGGTHIGSTAPIGKISVRRKGLGVGKERLSCAFPGAEVDTSAFRY